MTHNVSVRKIHNGKFIVDKNWSLKSESIIEMPSVKIMTMIPLLSQSSVRTPNNALRRVKHNEFCNKNFYQNLDRVNKLTIFNGMKHA